MAVELIADPVQNLVDTPQLPGYLHDQFPCHVYYRSPPTCRVQPSGKLLGASGRANSTDSQKDRSIGNEVWLLTGPRGI